MPSCGTTTQPPENLQRIQVVFPPSGSNRPVLPRFPSCVRRGLDIILLKKKAPAFKNVVYFFFPRAFATSHAILPGWRLQNKQQMRIVHKGGHGVPRRCLSVAEALPSSQPPNKTSSDSRSTNGPRKQDIASPPTSKNVHRLDYTQKTLAIALQPTADRHPHITQTILRPKHSNHCTTARREDRDEHKINGKYSKVKIPVKLRRTSLPACHKNAVQVLPPTLINSRQLNAQTDVKSCLERREGGASHNYTNNDK